MTYKERLSEPSLTPGNLEILGLVELPNHEIANRLGLNVNEVRKNLTQIRTALGAKDKTQALIRAVELGFYKTEDKYPQENDLPPLETLNPRERQLTNILLGPSTNYEDFADILEVSSQTIKNRISKILYKLGLSNKTQLVLVYLEARRRAIEKLDEDREPTHDEIFGEQTSSRIQLMLPDEQSRNSSSSQDKDGELDSESPKGEIVIWNNTTTPLDHKQLPTGKYNQRPIRIPSHMRKMGSGPVPRVKKPNT